MKKAIILMIVLFIIPLVMAVPPITTQVTDFKILEIGYPNHRFFLCNAPITLHFQLYNATGYHKTTTDGYSCSLHITNTTGDHIYTNDSLTMDTDNSDFVITLGSDLFDIGVYPYIIHCNNTNTGGYINTELVISAGDIEEEQKTINYIVEKSIFTNAIGIVLLLIALLLIFIGAADLGIKEENEN